MRIFSAGRVAGEFGLKWVDRYGRDMGLEKSVEIILTFFKRNVRTCRTRFHGEPYAVRNYL